MTTLGLRIAAIFFAVSAAAHAECDLKPQNCPDDILRARGFYEADMGEEAEMLIKRAKDQAGGELSMTQMMDCAEQNFGPGAWLEAADRFLCKKNTKKHQDEYEASKARKWDTKDYSPKLLPENFQALHRFSVERMKTPQLPDNQRWFGIVPGNSEDCGRGHHKGPLKGSAMDTSLVCPAYAQRLDDAFRLLENGTVKYLMLTGGSIDATRPDYNEAVRGKAFLQCSCGIQPFAKKPKSSCFTPSEKGDQPSDYFEYVPWCATGKYKGRPGCKELEDRVLIEPVATHTTTNIRNTDKFALDLGVSDGSLIVTEIPGPAKCYDAKEHQGPEDLAEVIFGKKFNKKPSDYIDQGQLSITDATKQGFFLTHEINSLAWAFWKSQVGYRPGTFDENHTECFSNRPPPRPRPIRVIQHSLRDYDVDDIKTREKAYGKLLDRLNGDNYGP